MTVIYQNEFDKVRKEYGNIMKEYVIPKDNNAAVDEVWNFHAKKIVPHIGVRKNISIK